MTSPAPHQQAQQAQRATQPRGAGRSVWESGDGSRSPWDVPSINDYAELLARQSVEAQAEVDELGRTDVANAVVLCHSILWVAAHGGSGARCIAAATGVGTVAGDQPATSPEVESLTARPVAVLVARTDARGLAAAAAAIQTVPRGVSLLGLVLSADAPGRLPTDLRRRIHELSGAVPVVVTVPWIKTWRTSPGTPDRDVTRAVGRLGLSFDEEAQRSQ